MATLGLVDANSAKNDNGALSKTANLKFASFTDGTSNTIRLVESSGRPHVYRSLWVQPIQIHTLESIVPDKLIRSIQAVSPPRLSMVVLGT
jgi:hypothetical protein